MYGVAQSRTRLKRLSSSSSRSVHVSIPVSKLIPLFPLSLLGVLSFVLYVCISISILQIRSSISFVSRFHRYALIYNICFSVSDLLRSGGQSIGPPTSTNDPFSPLYSNAPFWFIHWYFKCFFSWIASWDFSEVLLLRNFFCSSLCRWCFLWQSYLGIMVLHPHSSLYAIFCFLPWTPMIFSLRLTFHGKRHLKVNFISGF